MHLRHWILTLGLMLCAALPARASQTTSIDIDDFFYSDPVDTVYVGQTVTWTNIGAALHTTQTNPGPDMWNSGVMGPGSSFSHQFNLIGIFSYRCGFHANMSGKIVVLAATKLQHKTWGGLRNTYRRTAAKPTVKAAAKVTVKRTK